MGKTVRRGENERVAELNRQAQIISWREVRQTATDPEYHYVWNAGPFV